MPALPPSGPPSPRPSPISTHPTEHAGTAAVARWTDHPTLALIRAAPARLPRCRTGGASPVVIDHVQRRGRNSTLRVVLRFPRSAHGLAGLRAAAAGVGGLGEVDGRCVGHRPVWRLAAHRRRARRSRRHPPRPLLRVTILVAKAAPPNFTVLFGGPHKPRGQMRCCDRNSGDAGFIHLEIARIRHHACGGTPVAKPCPRRRGDTRG